MANNEPLSNPFAQQPESLPDPVPDRQLAQTNSLGLPKLDSVSPAPAPEEQAPKANNALGLPSINSGGADDLQLPENMVQGEFGEIFTTKPDRGFLESQVAFGEPEAALRTLGGLLKDNKQRVALYRKALGEENVKIKDDTIYIRRDNEARFKKIDPEALDLIGDIFLDNSRYFAVASAAVPTAGVVGAATPGFMPVKALAGVIAGAFAGGTVNFALDTVAEDLVGLPPSEATAKFRKSMTPEQTKNYNKYIDRAHNALKEGMYVSANEAAFGAVGALFSRARQASATEKAAMKSPQSQKAIKHMEQAHAANNIIKELDGIQPIPGSDMYVLPENFLAEVDPGFAYVNKLAMATANGQNLQRISADNIEMAVTDHLTSVLRIMDPKSVAKSKEVSGYTMLSETFGDTVMKKIKDYRSHEFRDMGQMLAYAEKVAGNKQFPLFEVAQSFERITSELPVVMTTHGGVRFTPEFNKRVTTALANTKKVAKEDIPKRVKDFQQLVNESYLLSVKGGQPKPLQSLNEFTRTADDLAAFYAGTETEISAHTARMAKAARDARLRTLEAMSNNSKSFKSLYSDKVELYGNLDSVENATKSLLKVEAIPQQAYAKKLYDAGKEGIDTIKKLQALFGKKDPEVLNNLRSAFLDRVFRESVEDGSINMTKAYKILFNKFGERYLRQLSGNSPKKVADLRNLMWLGKQQQKLMRKGDLPPLQANTLQILRALPTLAFGQNPGALSNAMAFLQYGKTQKGLFVDVLQSKTIDQWTKGLPAVEKAAVAKFINGMLTVVRESGEMATSNKGIRGQVGKGIRGAGLQPFREEYDNYVEQR